MKKTVQILTAVVMILVLLLIPAYAHGDDHHDAEHSGEHCDVDATDGCHVFVDDKYVCFENNEFYKLYESTHGNDYTVNESIMDEWFEPTVSTARHMMRYAAKLEAAPADRSECKKFLIMGDTDLDGVITLKDARCALRIAAKLEKGHHYHYSCLGTGGFWCI